MEYLYKVLLVDDEPLTLEGLKLMVDWESLGYKISGECGNGEEAVSLIEKLLPDLVITDIRMPVMDGLDLIEHVKKHMDQNIKFIILSGYNEFEYARRALKFEVNHYVLKPIFPEEMVAVLREMYQRLKQVNLPTRIKLEENIAAIDRSEGGLDVNDILYKIAHGGFEPEYLPVLQKTLGKNAIFQPWSYLIVETGFTAGMIEKTGVHDSARGECQDERDVIQRTVKKMFADACFIWEQDIDCLELLIGEDALRLTNFSTAADQLCRAISDEGVNGFYIAVGECSPDLYSLRNSYLTARQALNYKFFTEVNQVISYNEVKEKTVNHNIQITYLDAVIDALEDFNPEKIASAIEAAFSYFQTELLAPEIVKMFVLNIIYHSIHLIQEMNGNPIELLGKYELTHFEKRKTTMADLKSILQSYSLECCLYLKTLQERNSQLNIYRIEEYMKQNFKRNITIKEIAKNFYMHPAYIGQLFLKKFGFSFNEYLHRLRIREAKKLMAVSPLKTHEIAAEVGYNNYHSFLDNFKKYTGFKPVDYKSHAKHRL